MIAAPLWLGGCSDATYFWGFGIFAFVGLAANIYDKTKYWGEGGALRRERDERQEQLLDEQNRREREEWREEEKARIARLKVEDPDEYLRQERKRAEDKEISELAHKLLENPAYNPNHAWADARSTVKRRKRVCPVCHERGGVYMSQQTVKKGISGGKATAAILTGGYSMLATGLSRKEEEFGAYCENCDSRWKV